MDQIRVVFLGTGAGSPSRNRNVSSLAVVLDGRVLLFDCGEGTQQQIMRSTVSSGRIEAIFITHLHGDHLYGLPGLLATMSLNGRNEPLAVCGPQGLRAFLEAAASASRFTPVYRIDVYEIGGVGGIPLDGCKVVSHELDHTIDSFGFCVIEDDAPGEFDVAKARELGVPEGPLFGRLQRGEDVVVNNRVVRSADILGPPRRGRRIAICGDTKPCAAAVGLARGADLLVHEATYGSDMSDEAHERGHSTAEDAARVARDAGAAHLILTHFSARYEDPAPLVAEARRMHAATDAAADFAEFIVTR